MQTEMNAFDIKTQAEKYKTVCSQKTANAASLIQYHTARKEVDTV
jgi:hypothetical protein